MILLSSARLENQGLKWNETKTSLLSAGGTKALCEPVEAVVTFKSSSADSLSVYMLNPTGNRSDSLLVNQFGKSVKFSMNKNTLWYEISNHKKKVITQGKKIGKNPGENSLKASPNPGKSYTTIEFSFPENTEADFIIYNSFGQLVLTEQVLLASNQLQQKRIDISQFGDGIYFYGFQFKNGKRIIDKLVVSK
jgi:hypothetical protein